jgi:hypothetical protein
VPWKSDEEAAVKWILQRDPKFFEKSLPFIGYLQFRLENPPAGAERVEIELRYGGGGIFTLPRDQGTDPMKNRNGPWRFKAD